MEKFRIKFGVIAEGVVKVVFHCIGIIFDGTALKSGSDDGLLPILIIAPVEKRQKEYLQHFFYNSLFHFVFNLNPVNLVKTGYYLRTLKD